MTFQKKFDIDDLNKAFIEYVDSDEYPTIERFCLQQDMSRDTFYRLLNQEVFDEDGCGKENPLSDTKKKADQKAEDYLQRNALKNTVNPIFAMFCLKQKRHGWKDKQEITHGTEDGQPIIIKLEG
jgi:hypothetical protein